MKKIDTLSSLEGRKELIEIFKELRYEKQLSSFATLLICLRICINVKEIFRYVKKEITVVHTLGLFRGTALWMEEIVNRFYFSTINSFVYFGAAILLVLIGIRQFSESITNNMVIAGVAFEALMLIFIFIVMLFSPNDEINEVSQQNDEHSQSGELLLEVGEISRDFAAVVTQLEQLSDSLGELVGQQSEVIKLVSDIVANSAMAISPNPQMLQVMQQTNDSLEKFKTTVDSLNHAAELLKREEIETAVRREVERILIAQISG